MDYAPGVDHALWPFVLYATVVVLLGIATPAMSYVLGERHKERTTGEPYESGMVITGQAQVPVNVSFYLIAVYFVVFDLEAVFIFAWAVGFRDLGWTGYVEIVVFIAVLLAALVYLWRIGALELVQKRQPGDREMPGVDRSR